MVLRLAGSGRLEDRLPGALEVQRELQVGQPVRRLSFEAGDVTAWDSGVLLRSGSEGLRARRG